MSTQRTKYLFKNTAIFTIGSISTKMINFFLVPLYTNILSTSEYGTVDLVNTICTVLAPILILNISESVMRFALDKGADYRKILSTGIIIYICSLFLGLFILPVNSLFKVTSAYSIYIFFYTITLAGSQLFMCYLRGREMLAEYTIGNILHTLVIAGLNIVFLLVMKLGIKGYFLSYIISAVLTMVYALFVGKIWTVFKNFKVDYDLSKQMLIYSIVLIPNTFMWWIMNSSDRVMVTSMIGVAANGVYAISYKIPSLVTTFTTVFNQAWSYSAIKEQGAVDEEEYNNVVFKNLISIVMLVGVLLITITKPFLLLYVSKNYYEAWRYTPFLIIGFVYLTLASFMATSYTVHKDSFGFLFSGMFGALLNIVLNFALIPIIGTYGAALATCVSYISVFVFREFHTRKYIKYDIMNRKFFIGSILLLISAGILFINNIIIYAIQLIIVIITICEYRNVCIPIIRKMFRLKKFRK